MVGIYKITNIINGKVYIGQSINIKERWRHHRASSTNTGGHFDYPLYRSMRKHGIENFQFQILEECLVTELNQKELYYINQYNCLFPQGYNQSLPTQGGTKLISQNVQDIIYLLQTTELSDDEIGEQFQVSGRTVRGINYGESWRQDNIIYPIKDRRVYKTEHTCLICGALTENKKFCSPKCSSIAQQRESKPTKEELLDLVLLIKQSGFEAAGRKFGVCGNTIKKWCKSYGVPYLKKDIIEWYNKEMNISIPIKAPNKIPIEQLDPSTNEVIQTFESSMDAARFLGISKGSHITEVCKGHLKQAYGYKWRYQD